MVSLQEKTTESVSDGTADSSTTEILETVKEIDPFKKYHGHTPSRFWGHRVSKAKTFQEKGQQRYGCLLTYLVITLIIPHNFYMNRNLKKNKQ